MRLFTDLRRGLLAATSLATLQVASPAYAQYAPYPQTAQPYTQPAQNQYAPAAQPAAAQTYAQPQQYAAPVAPPVAQQAMAPQQVAPSTPYQQYSAAGQQVATQATQQYSAANQQAAQQFNAAAQQATQQYDAATQYVASRPGVAANYGAGFAYPAAPVQPQASPQPSAFQQVYPQGAPSTASAAPYGPVYTARAMQTPAPEAVQNLPLTPPTEAVPPGASAVNPQYAAPQPVPAPQQGYPATGGYESYPSGYGANGGGCATGNCAPYGAAEYSPYGCEAPGTMDRLLCRNSCNYWFGGVYGLLMQRDSSDKYNLGLMDDTMPPSGYPTMPDVVLTTADVDPGYQGGVEFRLGRTFGGVAADPCGCGPCCPQWDVEGVYWEIFDNSQYDSFMPSMPRYYSMMPMPGLQYDGGGPGGYLPVNSYWDYGPPVDEPNTYEVTNARVRSNFEARNIELNLLRLNLCGCAPACGPAMCDVGGCSTGYAAPARYNITGVCGVRYLELDDNFMYGVDYTGGATGYLDYYSQTENKLVGFQLGSNAMYRIGCKWGLHMNTLVGLYGNDIETHQYFNSTTGMVRYASDGMPFDANASKTDVAMLGELRLGASYQATCHCRLYGGWRAMGLTGLALATNQAPNQWLTSGQGSSYVNSNSSMILHGLQAGVEWNY